MPTGPRPWPSRGTEPLTVAGPRRAYDHLVRDPRPATVFDVAERAGVGKSTVSNVLQGKGRMSERTRSAVLAAARVSCSRRRGRA